jgi:hypothetical protein
MSVRAAVIMVLTFVFGIVPATMLVIFAIVLGAGGVNGLFVGDPRSALVGLAFIATSVLAVYGYVALFFAAGDAVTPKIARWLGGGIVANIIGIGLFSDQMRWLVPGDWALFVAPLVVGCARSSAMALAL